MYARSFASALVLFHQSSALVLYDATLRFPSRCGSTALLSAMSSLETGEQLHQRKDTSHFSLR